jgi:phosphoribosylanthranilate isomerase
MTRVKICGINDAQGFDAVAGAGADYVGINFFPPSPRFVTAEQAATLSSRHAGGPQRVALFVKPTDDEIAAVLTVFRPDILQIYDGAERAAAIRARFGLPVWRAVGVSDAAELPRDAGGVDALVIEAKPPKDATRPGGNAASFDWAILAGWNPGFDWVLAGGLTPENVADAVRIGHPPVVDVSSGVESAPGVKDPARIRAFTAAARQAAEA